MNVNFLGCCHGRGVTVRPCFDALRKVCKSFSGVWVFQFVSTFELSTGSVRHYPTSLPASRLVFVSVLPCLGEAYFLSLWCGLACNSDTIPFILWKTLDVFLHCVDHLFHRSKSLISLGSTLFVCSESFQPKFINSAFFHFLGMWTPRSGNNSSLPRPIL